MAFGGDGYFYEWCYDLCATTARKMGGGVGAGTVKETVTTAYGLVLSINGCSIGGECLPVGYSKKLSDRLEKQDRKGTQL